MLLYFAEYGFGTEQVWWSHPHFLDGFVSGRSLVVVGEHHPISISQPIPDATLQNVVNKGQAGFRQVQRVERYCINANFISPCLPPVRLHFLILFQLHPMGPSRLGCLDME